MLDWYSCKEAKKSMKSFLKKFSIYFFFILLIAYIYFAKLDVKTILDVFLSLSIYNIVILLGLYILLSFVLIGNKFYLFNSFGYKMSIRNLTLIHFASLTANYSTPAKIGYPLAVFLYKKLEKVPYVTSSSVILIELFISMGICGSITIIGASELIKIDYSWLLSFFPFLLFGVLLLCLMISIFWDKLWNSKVIILLKEAFSGIKSLKWTNLVIYTILMIINRLGGSFLFLVIVLILGGKINYTEAIIVSSASFFLGSISMIPLGLGVKEGTTLFFLNYYGISNEVSVGIIALDRAISTALSYVFGIFAGSILGIKSIKTNSFFN